MSEIQDSTKGYERVGRLLYGLQRICGGVEALRGLENDTRVASDTAARGAALAERYDVLYARFKRDADQVGSDEVEAFLDEALALGDLLTSQLGNGWMWRNG